MNKNRARRCLTGVDKLLTSQTWTGTHYWMVRSKLWRQADLTLPKRITVEPFSKLRLQGVVDSYSAETTPAERLTGSWQLASNNRTDIVAVGRRFSGWLRIGADVSFWTGLSEIVNATSDVWEMRVNLHRPSIVWTHGYDDNEQVVALLMGLWGEPVMAS